MRIMLVLLILFSLVSCATHQQKGMLIGAGAGAAAGAGIGAAVGGKQGAIVGGLLGTLLGGATGNLIGRHLDKQEAALRNEFRQEIADGGVSLARTPDKEAMVLSMQVLFDTNSAKIKPAYYVQLNRMIQTWQTNQTVNVLITGHTDNIGRLQYNRDLSAQRAEAIAMYMIQRSMPFAHLYTRGVGEIAPIADNNTSEGRKLNRRVEMVFYPSDQPVPEIVPLVLVDTEPAGSTQSTKSKKEVPKKIAQSEKNQQVLRVYAFDKEDRQNAITQQEAVKKATDAEPLSPIRPASELLKHS